MDISQTTAPKSDQQNFDDYISGPKIVTVAEVKPGTSEQPVEIHLVEYPGRPYKPSKSMRRVLVAAWGAESAPWAGRRMQLVGDPTVKFGGTVVGGIKIGALSHIDKRLSLNLTVTKGKRAPHVVEPLPDVAPAAPVNEPKLTPQQRAKLFSMFARKGIAEEQQLPGIVHIVGRPVTHRDALTTDEFDAVIAALASQPDAEVQS